ncbi:YMGG-like glycine zipper-containing protein [Haloprofundus salilacus]|uniref:YMGG-like glycine zipper-containing protein n=1 Tax=Haloprofundus salilacus TaxID=2876190 RepID=UPI001CCE6EF4|nr:glycine zipper 2TM domain-containing protein [Haloprofundus salilacus]
MDSASIHLRRMLSRARYAAIGAAIGAGLGGLFSKEAASTGGAIGALVGATFGETRVTARDRIDRIRARGEEEFKRIPLE